MTLTYEYVATCTAKTKFLVQGFQKLRAQTIQTDKHSDPHTQTDTHTDRRHRTQNHIAFLAGKSL